MNEVIRQLFQRKSMRVYTEQEISPADKALILRAAVEAPTAGNQQLYTILDITDQGIKDRLAETCDHQPMIAAAKLVLVFCADCKKWYDAYLATGCEPRKPGVGDLMLAVSDTMIAAQNAVTAAESLGIGSCYIGDVMENCAQQRELLHLPDYVFPVGMLIFGYPTQQQKDRPKPTRVEQKFIVHENAYRPMSEQELEEMWTPRSGGKSYREWMQAFCKRKYNSAFSREMSRSVAEYLGQYEEA
ncbi:MAG: nitroreductase family protein [Oscillospiraceae bacterium]